MEKARLLRLVTLLERHKDNGVRFNMRAWQRRKSKQRNWCGTEACAVGLAMSDRVLRKQGLSCKRVFFAHYVPEYNGLSHWDAVGAFFDIDSVEANGLFTPIYYGGRVTGNAAARRVAKRIREFIAEKETQSLNHVEGAISCGNSLA